jgi:hypothetical protein
MSEKQHTSMEKIDENEEPVHVESELKAMREYFANKGTANQKMKDELAFLLLRMILSTPVTPNSINATAQFLSPFVKFTFNDKLDEVLSEISEIKVSTNHQGKNLLMKWDSVVEKLEMYLEKDDVKEKDDLD